MRSSYIGELKLRLQTMLRHPLLVHQFSFFPNKKSYCSNYLYTFPLQYLFPLLILNFPHMYYKT